MAISISVPFDLLEKIWGGKVVLFLGAGSSVAAGAPGGVALEERLAKAFGVDKQGNLADTCEVLFATEERLKIERLIKEILEKVRPTQDHARLVSFPWKAIYTTNVDLVVERAWDQGDPHTSIRTVVGKNDHFNIHDSRTTTLFKLHGCISKAPAKDYPLVFSATDIERNRSEKKRLFDEINALGQEYTLLFIGYSFGDGVIFKTLGELRSAIGDVWLNRSYAAIPDASDAQKKSLATYGIRLIPGTLEGFVQQLDAQSKARNKSYSGYRRLEPELDAYGKKVLLPDELFAIVDREMEALFHTRLHSDVSNAFFRGAHPTWDDVHHGLDVRRDIYPDVLQRAIDSLEGRHKSKVLVLTGSAATGKSTLAMRVCYDIAFKHQFPVFRLKPETHWNAKTLDRLSDFLEGRPFLLWIDEAAYQLGLVRDLVQHSIGLSLNVTFLVTLRSNEWAVRKNERLLPNPTEIELPEQLSYAEARSLAESLLQRKLLTPKPGLGIEEITEKFRISMDGYLVVILIEMLEAGKFQLILRKEWDSLGNAAARKGYLVTALLHQFDMRVSRDHLLRILGLLAKPWHDEVLSTHLAKIVHDEWDDTQENEYYRTRHRVVANALIAQLRRSESKAEVFQAFSELVSKYSSHNDFEQQQLHLLAKSHEVRAFLAEETQVYDFFKSALDASGDSPWVYMHYSEWVEIEKGDFDFAEDLLERGLKMATTQRGKGALFQHLGRLDWRRMYKASDKSDVQFFFDRALERLKKSLSFDANREFAYDTMAKVFMTRATRTEDLVEREKWLVSGLQSCDLAKKNVPDEHLVKVVETQRAIEAELEKTRVETISSAASELTNNPERAYAISKQLFSLRDYAGALKIIDQSLKINQRNEGLLRLSIECLSRVDNRAGHQTERMRQQIGNALLAVPKDPLIRVYAGAMAINDDRPTLAAEHFAIASAATPGDDYRRIRLLDLGWLSTSTKEVRGTVEGTSGPIGVIAIHNGPKSFFRRNEGGNRQLRPGFVVAMKLGYSYAGPFGLEIQIRG